jgi:hypothetical protein
MLRVLMMQVSIGWVLSSFLAAQSDSPNTSSNVAQTIPYRRVFVPQSDLNSLGLQGYAPMDAKELEQSMAKYAEQHAGQPEGEAQADQSNGQLLASHYMARMIGADLVSDRSRLVLSRPSRLGERLTLQPWSLAVSSKPWSSASGSNAGWTYDEQGAPRVPFVSNDTERSGLSRTYLHGEVEQWFGWSLRAKPSSQPNKLFYSMDIPRCADSCLLLSLPPRAVIQDATSVAIRLKQWEQASMRLQGWPESLREAAAPALPTNAAESIWLIELGGVQNVSFSISLGESERGMDLRGDDDAFRFTQMVRTQRLDHVIDGQHIRTQCTAEVMISQHHQLPVRLSMAPDSRLRRWSVQGMDVPWDSDQGWIVWTPPMQAEKSMNDSVASSSIQTNYIPVTAEFVTPLQRDTDGTVVLPTFSFERSYVMTGRTSVQSVGQWRINSVNCKARIVEPGNASRTSATSPMEFAWQASPPTCSIGIDLEAAVRKVELLSQIAMDTSGAEANIRARFDFLDQDSSTVRFVLSTGWQLVSAEAIDRNDPVRVVRTELENTFELHWQRIERNRMAEVEFLLIEPLEAVAGKRSHRSARPFDILRFPGMEQLNTVSIEESNTHQVIITAGQLDRMLLEDSVAEWQRRLLPRSNRPFLFRQVLLPNAANDAEEPFLVTWREKPDLHRASLQTLLTADTSSGMKVQQEFQFQLGADRQRPLQIQLPHDGIRWSQWANQRWISCEPLEHLDSQKHANADFQSFKIPEGIDTFLLRADYAVKIPESDPITLRLPRIENTQVESHSIRTPSNAFEVSDSRQTNRWTIDDDGHACLQVQSPNSETSLLVKPIKHGGAAWSGWYRDLQVAVDLNGKQKCTLVFSCPQADLLAPIILELEAGWIPIRGHLQLDQRQTPLTFTQDGQRLLLGIDRTSTTEAFRWQGYVECQIELIGPSLKRPYFGWDGSRVTEFRWPHLHANVTLLGDSRSLWLPSELAILSDPERPSADGTLAIWPLWDQTQSLLLRKGNLNANVHDASDLDRTSESFFNHKLWNAPTSKGWYCALRVPGHRPSVAKDEAGDSSALRIVSRDNLQSLSFAILVLVAVLTPYVIQRSVRFSIGLSIAWILACQSPDSRISGAGYAGLIGMGIGFCVYALHRILSQRQEADPSAMRRGTTRWSPWNVRDERLEPIAAGQSETASGAPGHNPKTSIATPLGKGMLLMCIGVATAGLLSRLQAQSNLPLPIDDSPSSDAFAILIPVDGDGEMLGTNVYIPDELRDILSGRATRRPDQETGTRPVSARHVLKMGGRGKTDQIIMNYDFLISDELTPVRFPIADQVLGLRFYVDGTELTAPLRLRRIGTDWIWSPEKPGRRAIQIIGQPRLANLEAPKELPTNLVQQLDLALIPVANAIIDVEMDPQYSLDLASLGQITNPSAGKFTAMLGALNRLQCKFSVPASNVPTGMQPMLTTTDNLESTLMHTELFLNHDSVQAKTVFDFPKGIPISRQIEIEADAQWLPIGTHWGDAHWVELRSGSSLSRRRFVLEWNTPPSSNVNQRDRRITMIWVPQSKQQDLNVLFAECRNHRSRFGTLKYARTLGSEWTIEGINTWVPVFNTDERLDWSELKVGSTYPIATTLRIPFNGGGGILKHRAAISRQQARISSTWSLDATSETLAVRIELIGNHGSEGFYLELPANFQITEATHRNEPIRYLQRSSGDKRRVQFIADQSSFEIGDIKIQAKRLASSRTLGGTIPWIQLPPSIEADQTIKVFVSEKIAIRWENGDSINIPGRGFLQAIATLTRNEQSTSPGNVPLHYEVTHRTTPLVGLLVASVSPNGMYEAAEIEVGGTIERSLESQPSFVLEIPASLKDRWQSDLRISAVPCPDANKAWLQVSLPDWDGLDLSKNKVAIRFFPSSDDPQELVEVAAQIRPLETESLRICLAATHLKPRMLSEWQSVNEETRLQVKRELGLSQAAEVFERRTITSTVQTDEPRREEQMGEIAISQAIYEVSRPHDVKRGTQAILQSRFWIPNDPSEPVSHIKLQWKVDESLQVLSVCLNGRSIPYDRRGDWLECQPILAGLCAEVVLTTQHTVEGAASTIIAPFSPHYPADAAWVAISNDIHARVLVNGDEVSSRPQKEMIGPITSKWLSMFNSILEQESLEQRRPGSEWDTWQKYWTRRSLEYLSVWARSGLNDDASYGEAVETFHQTQSMVRVSTASSSNSDETNKPGPWVLVHTAFGLDTETDEHMGTSQNAERNLSLAGQLFVLTCVILVAHGLRQTLEQRPWWYLVAIGLLIWVLSGWLVPAILLGTLGFVVQLDTYWIANERLRRTGTRGLRSP